MKLDTLDFIFILLIIYLILYILRFIIVYYKTYKRVLEIDNEILTFEQIQKYDFLRDTEENIFSQGN